MQLFPAVARQKKSMKSNEAHAGEKQSENNLWKFLVVSACVKVWGFCLKSDLGSKSRLPWCVDIKTASSVLVQNVQQSKMNV